MLPSVRRGRRAPRERSRSRSIAVVFVVVAALVGDRVPLGPGRRSAIVLVAAWALAAVFVAVHRPREPLAAIIALAAFVGAAALFGAALAGRDVATATVRDFGSGLRGAAIALFPAVALHLVLGVPDGSLVSRARRLWVVAGYAASVVLAVVLVSDRPDLRGRADRGDRRPSTRWSVSSDTSPVTAAASSVQERARLQWPAWGVVVAGAVSLGDVGAPRAPVVARRPARRGARDVTCSSRCRSRSARRSGWRCASTACSCTPSRWPGWPRWSAASYLLIVLGLGRSPDRRREDAARPVDARRRDRRAAVDPGRASGSPSSRRAASTASATRPTRCSARSGAGSTRALPLDELLLQLAESLKKTMALERRRGLDTRRERPARARGVGARPRAGDDPARRRRRRRSSRARACRAPAWAQHLAARGPHRPRRPGAAGRADHELRRAARHDRRAPPAGRAAVQRSTTTRRSPSSRARSGSRCTT